MKLILVRHGQTEENVKKLLQGQGVDSVLNENGLVQAKKVADCLKEEKIDAIYSSDLKRAMATAQEIVKFHPNVKTIFSSELRERSLGIYEGKPSVNYYRDFDQSFSAFDVFKPDGSESLQEVQRRVGEFFDKISEKDKNHTVLLVGHGGIFTLLLLKLLNKQITQENCDNYKIHNASISTIGLFENKVHSIDVNSIHHLH